MTLRNGLRPAPKSVFFVPVRRGTGRRKTVVPATAADGKGPAHGTTPPGNDRLFPYSLVTAARMVEDAARTRNRARHTHFRAPHAFGPTTGRAACNHMRHRT